MKIAFIFPGQGAQVVGMGEDLYENSPDARRIFDEANAVLGFSLSRLCFDGPFEELTKTENCQPAVLTASIAALKVFEARYHGIKPSFVAGLSLGEYSALVAGGVMDFKDVLYLVRKRGEFMEAAAKKNPGKMSCILGLEREVLLAICEKTGCEIANLNCPGQIVISGKRAQLEEAGLLATAKGAERVIPLDVSGAFHCSLMNEASAQLKKEIEKVKFQRPQVPLVSNVDALEQTDPAVIKKNLIKQVDSATYWEESMRYLMARGIDLYFEIGPGSVLKGLFKKIDPNIKVITVGKWDEIEGLKDHPAFATCPRP